MQFAILECTVVWLLTASLGALLGKRSPSLAYQVITFVVALLLGGVLRSTAEPLHSAPFSLITGLATAGLFVAAFWLAHWRLAIRSGRRPKG